MPPPNIPEVLLIFVSSYYELTTERQYVNDVALEIPITKIIDYGNWLGINDIEHFIKIIRLIDYSLGKFQKEDTASDQQHQQDIKRFKGNR